MRWLVVRGGALGDFILTLPALERVRAVAGRVVLAGRPRFGALAPALWDQLIDLRGAGALWLHGAGELPEPFDAALVYTPGVAELLRAAGLPLVIEGPPRPVPGAGHAVEQLLAPLAFLGSISPMAPRLEAPVGARERVALLLDGARLSRPVVLAPGAGAPDKRWPGMAALAQALDRARLPVVWVPGTEEEDLSPPPGVQALSGLDLPELTALAERCGAWVGNDTGTTHLAIAAGAPALALFGPTDPEIWGPRPHPGAQALALPFSNLGP